MSGLLKSLFLFGCNLYPIKCVCFKCSLLYLTIINIKAIHHPKEDVDLGLPQWEIPTSPHSVRVLHQPIGGYHRPDFYPQIYFSCSQTSQKLNYVIYIFLSLSIFTQCKWLFLACIGSLFLFTKYILVYKYATICLSTLLFTEDYIQFGLLKIKML